MKKILVPTDFSEASRKASEYAARLAKTFDATLQLLYVFLEPAAIGEVPSIWLMTEMQLQEENDVLIKKEVAYLNKQFGVRVQGKAVNGFKSEEISANALEIKADLIVMGMKGSGGSKLMGSTTLSTMRKTKIPLIVVPEDAVFSPLKNITFATDYSEKTNLSCFGVLFDIACMFDSNIRMVNVRENAERMRTTEIAGKVRLENVLSSLKHDYYTVQDRNVESGIKSFLEKYPTDLLAMVAHHHNVFEYLFGTIHTRSMCQHINLPVLILEDK